MKRSKDVVNIIPLTEEEISKLPFPETARTIGGLLIVEPDYTAEEWQALQLKIEVIRKQFNDHIANAKEFKCSQFN